MKQELMETDSRRDARCPSSGRYITAALLFNKSLQNAVDTDTLNSDI